MITNFNKSLFLLILAAGKGIRMKSQKPKVLHTVCGKPMIHYVIRAAKALNPGNIFVVINSDKNVKEEIERSGVKTVIQEEQLGTGHAVNISASHFSGYSTLMLLYGDMPLVKSADLELLLQDYRITGSSVSILSTIINTPSDFGRIVRDSKGDFTSIIEVADADPEQIKITEVNTGIYCFRVSDLMEVIEEIDNRNAKGEYYITECVNMLRKKGKKISVEAVQDSTSFMGINSREQLALADAVMRKEICIHHMNSGVMIYDPVATYIDDEVKIGQDTTIYPGTYITGKSQIGSRCIIGPNTFIADSLIGDGIAITHSVVKGAEVMDDCNIGPYSYLRPGSVVLKGAKVGSFCEINKSFI